MNVLYLKEFREKYNIDRDSQASMLEITIDTLNNWEYRTKKIPKTKIKHIEYVFDMYKNNKSKINEPLEYKTEVTQVPEDDYMMVEYADLRTSAGSLGAISIEQLPETNKRLVPKEYANGEKYLVVRVDGSSMDDNTNRSLCDGDEILIKEYLLNNGDKLPFRNNLFVISSNQGDVVKQIIKHDNINGIIICRSFNSSWEDYDISMEDVFSIFTVQKIVSRKPKF